MAQVFQTEKGELRTVASRLDLAKFPRQRVAVHYKTHIIKILFPDGADLCTFPHSMIEGRAWHSQC